MCVWGGVTKYEPIAVIVTLLERKQQKVVVVIMMVEHVVVEREEDVSASSDTPQRPGYQCRGREPRAECELG